MKHQRLQISLLIFIILLLTEGANAQLYNNSVKKKQPNIIVFIVDDMGWQDCSVPFYKQKTKWNTIYHTPNMGKLAAEGMKFTNAYATPVCSPSRVSLMTGMNAARHRVTNWTLESIGGLS
jgi:arylsulfatase A-like enzyme